TVEQIKADMKGNEYTIVWGDTLSGISQATNISVQKLADMNKIANVDLIYAGNKLVFDGNVATVQNNKGETVVQSVIQPQDKVDSTKPVGQPATSQGTTSNNTTNSATQNTTTPSTGNTVTGNTQTGGQTTGNTGSTTPSTPENNGGTTQTPTQPSQPDNNGNQNGSTGGNTGGGQTTPSNPGNNEGNQGGSTGGNTGGSTTDPSQPTTPEKPVQYKYTVWGNFDDPKYNIVEGQHIFDTQEEARAWIDNYADNLLMQGIGSSSYGTTSWEVK
ncbi:LysM peptidoglycan-binding domain-containing protein, partial [Enterococcus hirae]